MIKYMNAGISGRFAAGLFWVALLSIFGCQTLRTSEPAFTVRVRHISDFQAHEDHVVHLHEGFFIADTDLYVKLQRFVPDFELNMNSKEVVSRSNEPLNPALQLAVSFQEDLLYESWILYQNLIPHAIHEPGYYFQFIAYEDLK
ncbi:MAG: hypothetical protein C4520_00535 [Candidatus Abyssobacteria bacterium SURF_5]|uniref:Uncharacterized protein n=1 Tax=Abyssobacteria bacterium (strain SURF_5) TaxID=2093360 RepID=A0A3A4P6V4_ABYX5|nr:MAG: hypothetical protein C4520_00535 [Candidatus Abyssubacteria bacterium SURF_5]